MDTGDNTDMEKIEARREKHRSRGINGNGFGESLGEAARKWPGPATLDSTNTRNSTANRSNPNSTHSVGDTLCDAVLLWMGPNVPNGGRTASHAEMTGRTAMHNGKKVQIGLEHQASKWAGPTAQNHKVSSEGSITRSDGKSREDILSYQAEQFFRLPSSPDRPMAGGSMSSTDGPNSNQPSVKRKLNPIFVEALMRWPTGLSGFERQETAWTRWWLLMPSFLSTLCSPPVPSQGSFL